MKKLSIALFTSILFTGSVLANECSLYSNVSVQETQKTNMLHIPKKDVEPLIITAKEFRSECNHLDYCHTKDAIYTTYKKQLGTSTEHKADIKRIEFIGKEYETSKKNETFVDIHETKGSFSINNDLMVCGYKEPILYVKLPITETRMSLFNNLISPNSIFSRNHISEFEKMVIQDI